VSSHRWQHFHFSRCSFLTSSLAVATLIFLAIVPTGERVRAQSNSPSQQQLTPTNADTATWPARGPKDAEVTIAFFDDPQCPHSARAYRMLFDEVLKDYAGSVRVVMASLPNSSIHPWAKHAAINGSCLAKQSSPAFWDYSDYIHAHQAEIGPDAAGDLDKLAVEAAARHGLAITALESCIAQQPDSDIKQAFSKARTLGVTALPTLFINGEKVQGAVPAADLREVIDRALHPPAKPLPRTSQRERPPLQPHAGSRGTPLREATPQTSPLP
jgi:protein-disulfide isomerase